MRMAVVPSWVWLTQHWRRVLIIGSILISLVLMMLIAVPPAHADSPFNDVTQPRPQGGGTGSITSAELPALPPSFAELPPPLLGPAYRPAATGALAPLQQQTPDTNPNNPLAWMSLSLNPGKWLLDSVLGATTGIIYSLASVFEVLGRFGSGQIVELNGQINSTSDTAFNLLFTTPEALTISWPGASGLGSPQAMHNVIRQAALSILVIVCTYRAVFVLTGNSFRSGLTDLLLNVERRT
ncbi:hypothetical protein [Candidatus Viridilinea mediisalina]|uniref:Uncharacterized protein n=1 Tax=Candidatus Viridilinea mediisalina TaxID=2024553 RepID=A0A2A6RPR5_9CHLR|nr:hypothetical protein [Candidatus Viridilinea mediisalina]PDW05052.1 hypothetical protein CJ255_00225 [Candidatus Viridilinea mediisalina]